MPRLATMPTCSSMCYYVFFFFRVPAVLHCFDCYCYCFFTLRVIYTQFRVLCLALTHTNERTHYMGGVGFSVISRIYSFITRNKYQYSSEE